MTYQEAIEMMKKRKFGAAIRCHEETVQMCELAIKALEKQMPKKPTLHDYTITVPFLGDKQEFDFLCVSCGCAVYSDDNCCPNCGQALDWSDD